jgi:hypothetical protein
MLSMDLLRIMRDEREREIRAGVRVRALVGRLPAIRRRGRSTAAGVSHRVADAAALR